MKKVLDNHLFLWKLCFKASPGFMLYYLFDNFRYEFCIFLEHCLAIRYVLHCAEYHEPFWKALLAVGGLLLLLMILMIPDGYYNHGMVFKCKPRLYKALKEQLYEKAAHIDLSCYDDPVYYNDFVLAVAEAETSIDRFLELIQMIVRGTTVIFTTGVFYLAVDKMGIVFIAISFVLRFLIAKRINKINYDVRLEVNPLERKRNYVSRVFYLKDYAKELRLHKEVGQNLEEEFKEANKAILKENKKVSGKRAGLMFTQRYLFGDFITDGLYVAYLIYCAAVLHTIDYSNAVVLFNRLGDLRENMALISDVFPKANENSLYIDKIRDFLALEPMVEKQIGSSVPNEMGELKLSNVSFRYNEKSREILKNISLTVKPGEKIAIVGYNGAGKTTLIKLLMRLYDPTEGTISYCDNDIREYNPFEYRQRIGVVFQDYQLFGASLAENIVLDNMEKTDIEKNRDKLENALVRSGFESKYRLLNKDLYTSVTTEFDKEGTDFSGGESQKIAISRAFYKNADILIMDEPSSALDPIAEYELNKAMEKAAMGRTVFYISHRLSTTRDADRILMMEKGQIIEEGSHEELLKLNGKYAAMWEIQASNYR